MFGLEAEGVGQLTGRHSAYRSDFKGVVLIPHAEPHMHGVIAA
jgi:hypothetical protein